ncbi:MAG TPA: hypothetical protein VMA75_00640 [Candidatus Paceibacterota bacterium]|nr:hypothetical protein [Candidatus Paceibacterota bacterium]
MNIRTFLAKDEPAAAGRGTVADRCFVFACTVLFYLFSNLLITGIAFLLYGRMTVAIEIASMVLTAGFAYFFCKPFFPHARAAAVGILLAAIALFAAAILLNAPVYDISYDGQTYQQEAVIQLSNGWNPVYQDLANEVIGGDSKWINYYPKSSWINESYIYLLTHAERTAKALNAVLIIVSIVLVYVALTDTGLLGSFNAWVVSIILGCNPISFNQIFSFYVDGQLMSLLLCICAAGMIMYAGKRRWGFVPLFLALPAFINLKFTGLVDAIIILFVLVLALWMKRVEIATLKALAVGAAAIAIGVLVIGASPYITNVVRYGTPFYPLYGPNAIDLKPYNVPGNFLDKSSPEILFLSMFTQSGDLKEAGTTAPYKLPFTYSPGELVAFRYPDPVEGGFGPLFGGAVILTVFALALYYLWARRQHGGKNYRRTFWGAAWLMLAAVVMCVVNPISSLARYVPQAYFIVMIPIILLLATRRAWSRVAAYAIIALLAANSWIIGSTYVSYNLRTSRAIAADLASLAAESKTESVLVYFNEFRSTRVMLAEAGVRYTATNNPDSCLKGFQYLLPENTTEFCVTSG